MSEQTSSTKILVVEDEPKIARLISDYLRAEQFDPIWVNESRRVIETMRACTPSLILLDVMLPGKNGFEICEEIRSFSQTPIIMVTARGHEQDRLRGFELGADDYICKPFSPRELVSRVKAVLKRLDSSGPPANPDKLKLEIDYDSYTAKLDGNTLDLTPLEFRLLTTLAQSPGRVFSRNELLDKIYPGHRVINDRTIDSHVKNLRRKLSAIDPTDNIVHSIYGVGYKFEWGQESV